jgi:pyruvate/2-oxoglutarate dehydrogenase complex dihydrolipoamide dehydrogenase (E3) component
MRGEEDRIRPCVGVGYCIDRIYEGGEALCIHNPATGREATMPHVIARSDGPARKVVVVGAGPAGLEAARVSAARGHRVVLLEAAPLPGGQVRLAAALGRRREIIGIVDWLASETQYLGVEVQCNVFAEADDVLAAQPEVVIIATGGVPNTSFLAEGEELAVTPWDTLGGQVAPARDVQLFDANGAHPGAACAEFLARGGARLALVTPERVALPEIGGTNYPAYFKAFGEHGVRVTLNRRLRAIRRQGNQLAAVLYDEYARASEERLVDQVVIEHGTLPADEVYFELKPQSSNLGEIDLDALIAGRPQGVATNPDGRYQLFRVGDAVAGRNIHAAMYDSLRLCKNL